VPVTLVCTPTPEGTSLLDLCTNGGMCAHVGRPSRVRDAPLPLPIVRPREGDTRPQLRLCSSPSHQCLAGMFTVSPPRLGASCHRALQPDPAP
jgi:hypothetical protein